MRCIGSLKVVGHSMREHYSEFKRDIKQLINIRQVRKMRGELHRSIEIDALQLDELLGLLKNKENQIREWNNG